VPIAGARARPVPSEQLLSRGFDRFCRLCAGNPFSTRPRISLGGPSSPTRRRSRRDIPCGTRLSRTFKRSVRNQGGVSAPPPFFLKNQSGFSTKYGSKTASGKGAFHVPKKPTGFSQRIPMPAKDISCCRPCGSHDQWNPWPYAPRRPVTAGIKNGRRSWLVIRA